VLKIQRIPTGDPVRMEPANFRATIRRALFIVDAQRCIVVLDSGGDRTSCSRTIARARRR